MRFLVIALLLIISCAKAEIKRVTPVYINVSEEYHSMTQQALLQLQIQSKVVELTDGTLDNHTIVINDALTEELDRLYNGTVLGVAWIFEKPCRIQISERTYFYGQDWVDSVVWHEIGHCLGMPHSTDKESIMYRYSKPLSMYTQESLHNFFRRIYEATR